MANIIILPIFKSKFMTYLAFRNHASKLTGLRLHSFEDWAYIITFGSCFYHNFPYVRMFWTMNS